MEVKEPPIALVKTWVSLINSNEDKVVKDHAANMLITSFGSIKKAAAYCKLQNIKLTK